MHDYLSYRMRHPSLLTTWCQMKVPDEAKESIPISEVVNIIRVLKDAIDGKVK